jgi:membrane protein implicated in regulation of membrane protease activity
VEEWFNALTLFEQIYWITAILGSLLLIILLVLTLFGGDADDIGDIDGDLDLDAGIDFQFLSFKNLVGFFAIFGWSGIACLNSELSYGATLVISLICGLSMMLAMAFLFYYLSKLNSSGGAIKIPNALGGIGEVYSTIGANRSTIGKVQIKIQDRIREIEALTDEDFDLKQGNIIIVSEITNNGLLIVNKYSK